MDYFLHIHDNSSSLPSESKWSEFFRVAGMSGMFIGGSAIGERDVIGNRDNHPHDDIVGYMRFTANSKEELINLLKQHPVVRNGGSVELCELPKD